MERIGEREHLAEANEAVAAHARVRRAAGLVPGDEVVDDLAPKLVAQVERDVRNPHAVSESARTRDGLQRATALSAVPARVRPKLERDSDDVVAGIERHLSSNRRIDATRHRDQRSPATRSTLTATIAVNVARVLRDGPERAVERVGGQS